MLIFVIFVNLLVFFMLYLVLFLYLPPIAALSLSPTLSAWLTSTLWLSPPLSLSLSTIRLVCFRLDYYVLLFNCRLVSSSGSGQRVYRSTCSCSCSVPAVTWGSGYWAMPIHRLDGLCDCDIILETKPSSNCLNMFAQLKSIIMGITRRHRKLSKKSSAWLSWGALSLINDRACAKAKLSALIYCFFFAELLELFCFASSIGD